MKKVFALSVSAIVCLFVVFACKKSNTTNNSSTSSTSTTGPSINTSVTNFTVDATAASNPISQTNNTSGNFVATGIDGSSQYPRIQLVFPGTASPASGTYGIVNTNGASPSAGHCELILYTTSGFFPASSGNVTVAAGTGGTSAYFGSVTCTYSGTTHTVTGNIKW